MKKKRILIASIIFILIICIVTAVFIIKNRNRSTSNTMYTYGSGDVRCNYSQDNVLYLDDSGILHLIDTASGKDMVYCDKPNCTHEGFSGSNEKPSCPAAFYGLEGAGTVLYNDHLYFIGNMSEEDMTIQYLYVMDSNGENRKKTAKLENVQNVTAVLYRDNYVIGAYSNRIELNDEGQIINDDKPEAGIFVIDLDNYKVYMSDKITSEQANITDIYYKDEVVYYSTVRFGDDVTELMIEEGASDDAESFAYDNMLNGIYQYDIADEKTTCLTEIDHINDLRLLDGDGYYSSKDGYFVFDTESRQTRQLPIDADGKTQYGPLKKSGDFLYYALSEEKSDEVTYYRLKDDKSEELMKLSTEKAFGIASICGQSVYVTYTNDNGKFCLGVISLDELNKGVFEPKELRCFDDEE